MNLGDFLTWLELAVEWMYEDPSRVPGGRMDDKVAALVRLVVPHHMDVKVEGRFDLALGRRYDIRITPR